MISPVKNQIINFGSALAAHSTHELCRDFWEDCFSGLLEREALAEYLQPKDSVTADYYVFNFDLLHQRAANALPVMAGVRDANAPLTWHLGGLHFGTTRRKRIYLSYLKPDEILMGASCILAIDRTPCFLLTPFHDSFDERVLCILNALDITTISVGDVLKVDCYGKVALRRPLHHKLAEYAKQEMDACRKARTFPVPTGIEWKDIRFHFLDNHTVTCSVGRSHSTFTFKGTSIKLFFKSRPVVRNFQISE